MARFYIDCRKHPSEVDCSLAIAADSVDELVEAATQHAVAVHSEKDSPELRQMIRDSVTELNDDVAAA